MCVLFCGAGEVKADLTELDKCRPMIVRQGEVKRMLEWLIHVCVFSREHLPPERQQPEHLIREIGLELVTSEALATPSQGMSKRSLFLNMRQRRRTWGAVNKPDFFPFLILIRQRSAFNTPKPNAAAKPQVVFIHHPLITPRVHWEDVTGGRTAWENILDLPDYSRFYADVREGLFTGRKCAERYPTPLSVTVDGHPGRFAHTILRDGDLCAVVCTVEGRAWRDRSSGKWHGRLTSGPLRIRAPQDSRARPERHDTPDHAPADRPTQSKRVIVSPVKRSQ
ncbi:BZ3500_MvSof-1268-A1-R1_Chr11-1g03172 [Microbotryum saponariae]|uniref:BZ3500_MvSof-1268-A1-R1_Chr11-1g03172 protein n=1 Tax=Microbotryum saponariae TaxID=289078 RepID=A0A2X0N8Q9_9BASI|nr:BZ3501_MvSof-1269-A2-R1_Chr11g02747 [Microbotryum saponariae]SDA03732.1 BZ3500_MvSof-1268-A1-R1_Chr11-1g03172 [Microbotryum saponariae]